MVIALPDLRALIVESCPLISVVGGNISGVSSLDSWCGALRLVGMGGIRLFGEVRLGLLRRGSRFKLDSRADSFFLFDSQSVGCPSLGGAVSVSAGVGSVQGNVLVTG